MDIQQIKSEMDALSPTAQFAAYFRKQRSLNKMYDELKGLSKFTAN